MVDQYEPEWEETVVDDVYWTSNSSHVDVVWMDTGALKENGSYTRAIALTVRHPDGSEQSMVLRLGSEEAAQFIYRMVSTFGMEKEIRDRIDEKIEDASRRGE